MKASYRDRGAVEVRTWFAARCEMRKLIGAAFQAMTVVAVELNQSMGATVRAGKVRELTKNVAFEEIEEQEPLKVP